MQTQKMGFGGSERKYNPISQVPFFVIQASVKL